MGLDKAFWDKKRVLVTGHTGFKGGWLSHWLTILGARVYGYALPVTDELSFFETALVDSYIEKSILADVRDLKQVSTAISEIKPDIVFHLAAQPLVPEAIRNPFETLNTNILGTMNLLESMRVGFRPSIFIHVSSDKTYLIGPDDSVLKETASLGGIEPYSASKSCADIIVAAYYESYFKNSTLKVSSARAGNVFGGGDWSRERLVPDFIRAWDSESTLLVRSADSIRPWQHVLDVLYGYIALAQALDQDQHLAGAWNFGPYEDSKSVSWVLEELQKIVGPVDITASPVPSNLETHKLRIDSSKARNKLGWHPPWDTQKSLIKTVEWYKAWKEGRNMAVYSIDQIKSYSSQL